MQNTSEIANFCCCFINFVILKVFLFCFWLFFLFLHFIDCSRTNTIVLDRCNLIRKHLDQYTLGLFDASLSFFLHYIFFVIVLYGFGQNKLCMFVSLLKIGQVQKLQSKFVPTRVKIASTDIIVNTVFARILEIRDRFKVKNFFLETITF